jgi:hypothetical protein
MWFYVTAHVVLYIHMIQHGQLDLASMMITCTNFQLQYMYLADSQGTPECTKVNWTV